ncbi:KpsF/GutQ family sugar-phosphate isomerase [Rhodalgimonas zhirmunskyi]|uniref:KpsF/GutQ family sugar-phosphate isomerase n=1 Tax=Rhodalgimonas zhirmunskyi TaxID=2964767 RepID=A0AAJ1X5Y8_9RHOB|nr:KpsF/GutQ family sugar-phosphate isomerase [Rhodoalgimonas zhirmunskyi]MDQ2095723.1 KpsF/GutQ family sugar-phosphate isomerase [Rhodoalgimonas zhirmunskyi]
MAETEKDITASADRLLRAESAALARLARELPADFAPLVSAILALQGRVILSGIGKSGHIARKIASTLASTGTPSFFVHPAEASHGDLGMVTKADLCILISNSGETRELADLISYTRRFSIPLAGISSRPASSLMQAADYRLTLPDEAEACPMGLAPTTSTTMTLALGDALAVALMDQRAFVAEEFKTFHPGGKLGAQLLYVHQVMHGPEALALVAPDADMTETLMQMSAKGFGLACVVDKDGKLAGVISDGDIRRNASGIMEIKAGDIATKTPRTVTPGTLAAKALSLMNQSMIGAIVVIDDGGAPVGILRVHDCLRAGVA